MVGLQGIADVAQLVERRLPKPRQRASVVMCGDLSSSVLADESPANWGVLDARCERPGFSAARRSGVLVASNATNLPCGRVPRNQLRLLGGRACVGASSGDCLPCSRIARRRPQGTNFPPTHQSGRRLREQARPTTPKDDSPVLSNPKRTAILIATLGALVIPAAASANQTASIPGFNCSVTAYTPTFTGGPSVNGQTGVSCGGAQVSYSKQANTQLVDLVTGGWQVVTSTGWSAYTTTNPLIQGLNTNCVPGRWYAVISTGQISHGGTVSGAQANSEGSGAQCP